MSVELLTRYTVRADRFADLLKAPGIDKVIASWSVMFGPVTQLLFLQAIPPGGEPPETPLPDNPATIERQERQFLCQVRPYRHPDPAIRLFELRRYQTRVGEAERFVSLMIGALPIREGHSPNCGIWTSLSGPHGEVLHLWGYRDLAQRDEVRAALRKDDEWGRYTGRILPLLQTLESTILQPL